MSDTPDTPSSGGASLEGYLYQLDVSVWTALDQLLAKQVAQSLVLEPASQEDLESDIDGEAGALVQGLRLDSYRLIIQCKVRNTGPWKHGDLTRLLAHGTRRKPARTRLEEEPAARYLLVTNADVDGVARQIMTGNLGKWPPAVDMPKEMAAQLPTNAPGRVAVLASLDVEKINARTDRLLTERFRLPRPNIEACREQLRKEALTRMRGAGAGVWTRDEVADVVVLHGGDVGDRMLAESFVPPTNWKELDETLATQHAVIITGPSGTGKTETAKALLTKLRRDLPGVNVVRINGGPEKIHVHIDERPVAFYIEDPWGRFRLEPGSIPWRGAINELLRKAGPDCKFVITSRSDVLAESGPKSLPGKWVVNLKEDHYGVGERRSLFENRLRGLPRALQLPVLNLRAKAVERLSTPLEMQLYFDALQVGPEQEESERDYVDRCLAKAHQESMEKAIFENVISRNDWRWAALVWGMFKARERQSFNVLPLIQSGLTEHDRDFEDGLEPYVNFLVAGHNLRQSGSSLTYHHPRVEQGLEMALNAKPELSSRTLLYLVETLIDLDTYEDSDWGREGAVHLVAAARSQKKLRLRLGEQTQEQLDKWIRARLTEPGPEFEDDLELAAVVGSRTCMPAELARWLTSEPVKDEEEWGFATWSPAPATAEWYDKVRRDPATGTICEAFIRRLLPLHQVRFPSDFSEHIGRVAPGLAPAFRDAALFSVGMGHTQNDDAIVTGAMADLPGFEPVVDAALAWLAKCREGDDSEVWLALANGEYDEEDEEFYGGLDDQCFTAQFYLDIYAKTLRRQQGWTALRDRCRVADLRYSWLAAIRYDNEASVNEWLALAEACVNTSQEALFWERARNRWTACLAPLLIKRLCVGGSDEVREQYALALACNIPSRVVDVVDELLPYDERRLLELVLDLQAAGWDEEQTLAKVAMNEIIATLPPHLADAALAIVGTRQAGVLSRESLASLRVLDPRDNYSLSLAQARAMAACNVDVTDILEGILTAPCEASQEQLIAVKGAVELAIEAGIWRLVEASLRHRYADVRETALSAIARRTAGPLGNDLLGLVNDKGHRVRKTMLELLKSRPCPEHFQSLLRLTADTWSRRSYDFDDPDYPLAVEAATCLRDQFEFDVGYSDKLIQIAQTSKDSNVGRVLLAALVRKGSDESRTTVIELAQSRRAPLNRIAVDALCREAQKLDARLVERITLTDLDHQPIGVAVGLVFVVGVAAGQDHVIAMANALAVSRTRAALLVPLWLGAIGRTDSLVEKFVKLLPSPVADALEAAVDEGPPLSRGMLDEFGDIRVVEAITSRFPGLFEPKAAKSAE